MSTSPTVRYIRDVQLQHAQFMCTGKQLAEVIATCSNVAPGLFWWAADVEVTDAEDFWSPYVTHEPVLLGGAEQFLSKIRMVDQFRRGVFLGQTSRSQARPIRSGGFWTEDEDPTENGGIQIELRAFDTTYLILYSWDETISAALDVRFFTDKQS
jgi:hypothetical protein